MSSAASAATIIDRSRHRLQSSSQTVTSSCTSSCACKSLEYRPSASMSVVNNAASGRKNDHLTSFLKDLHRLEVQHWFINASILPIKLSSSFLIFITSNVPCSRSSYSSAGEGGNDPRLQLQPKFGTVCRPTSPPQFLFQVCIFRKTSRISYPSSWFHFIKTLFVLLPRRIRERIKCLQWNRWPSGQQARLPQLRFVLDSTYRKNKHVHFLSSRWIELIVSSSIRTCDNFLGSNVNRNCDGTLGIDPEVFRKCE